MSHTSPLPIRVAQTLGLTTSILVGGCNLTISAILVPSLLKAPATLLLRQWHGVFSKGKAMALPLALVSAFSYAYLAYVDEDKTKAVNYAAAGVLAVGIMPYTLLVMNGTNSQLLERVDSTKVLGLNEELTEVGLPRGKSAHELVDWWGVLCLGRAAISIAAGVWGAYTSLD